LEPEITVEEYIKIREDISSFLEERAKTNISSFDKLPTNKHKQIVLKNAEIVLEKSKLIEPTISKDLFTLTEFGISEFKSLEHRIKDLEGLKRKIISDSKDYEGSFSKAAEHLRDGVRYTIVLPDDMYVLKTDEYLHKIEDMGYTIEEFKNCWGKPLYQGFNVIIKCPNTDDCFELQFHTPFGYQIKEGSTRDLYQVVRDDDISPEVIELKQKANKLRRIFQGSVPIPDGAKEYDYNSDKRLNMGGLK